MRAQDPLQFVPIELEPRTHREQKTLELGLGTRRVVFGPWIRPRLEIQDEHVEVALEEHGGEILAALKLSDGTADRTRFLTVGADHRLAIWTARGDVEHVLAGHSARIGGVWELTGSRIASWGEDGQLILWNTRDGSAIARIDSKVRTVDRVHIGATGDFLCITGRRNARILAMDGDELAVLRWQREPVTGVRRLESGRFITKSKHDMKLWSWRGTLQRRFPRAFSLADGYFDLPGGQLLVVDENDCIELLGPDGARLGSRASDADMAKALRRFLANRASARAAIAARPNFTRFEHRVSPVAVPEVPRKDARNEVALLGDKPRAQALWDFFQRPDLKSIRTWRRSELDAALHARDTVHEAVHDHRTVGLMAQRLSLIFCGCFGAATMSLFQVREIVWLIASLGAILLSSYLAIMLHLKAVAMSAAERALTPLLAEFKDLAAEIHAHRRDVLMSLPSAIDTALYAGVGARREIERTIAGELRDAALQACGLRAGDLVTWDSRPLVLDDWTLLRHADTPDDDGAIPPAHLRSFWWTPDGSFVCAVQTLQFILPGRETIDVYSVDYDFIARRAWNAKAHTVYYDELTDFVVRDVRRLVALPGISTSIDATEITFVSRSGERVSLIALDGDSALGLRRAVRAAVGPAMEEEQRVIEDELAGWHKDVDRAERERRAEIASLQAQRSALRAESLAADVADPMRRRPDDVIETLRGLILGRKKDSGMSGTG